MTTTQHTDIDDLFEQEDQQLLSESDRIYPTEEEMTKRLPFFKQYWVKLLGLGSAGLFMLWLIMEALKGFSGPVDATVQEPIIPKNQEEIDALRRERDNLQGTLAVQGQRQNIPVPQAEAKDNTKVTGNGSIKTPLPPNPKPAPAPVTAKRVVRTNPPTTRRIPAPTVRSQVPTPRTDPAPIVIPRNPTPAPKPIYTASIPSQPVAIPQSVSSSSSAKDLVVQPEDQWAQLASANTFSGSTESTNSQYRRTPLTTPPPVIKPITPKPLIPRTPEIQLGTKAKAELLTPLAWTSGQRVNQNVLITLTEDFGPYKKGGIVSASVASTQDRLITLSANSIASNGRNISLTGIQISGTGGRPLVAKVKKTGGNGLGRDILNGAIGIATGALSDVANDNNQVISFGNDGQVSSINTQGGNGLLGSVANSASNLAANQLRQNNAPRDIQYFYLKEGSTVELTSIR